ncbi:MAG: hypothetical protein Q4C47_05835 [Planctomycetia bacterium]|nr:hypothetical protein [Planctomycetia bacterium]
MSRRNRDGGTPVSLFSFQDIIMSVAGIMLLVTLLLTLEVIQKIHEQISTKTPPDLASLEEQIHAVRQDLESLRHRHSADDLPPDELLELTPEELTIRNEEERRRVEQLHAEIPELTRQRNELMRRRTVAEIPRNGAEVPIDPEILARRLEEIQTQREEIEQGEVLCFNPPKGFQGRMWLIDCDGTHLRMWPLDGASDTITLSATTEVDLAAEFLTRLPDLKGSTDSLMFFARPGAGLFCNLVIDLLRERGFSVGLELLGRDQRILISPDGAELPDERVSDAGNRNGNGNRNGMWPETEIFS